MSPWSLGTAPLPRRGSAGGARCKRGVGCGVVGVTAPSSRASRPPHGKALVRVERPRLDEVALVGLPAELLHCPGEAEPVEQLLLAGLLDVGERGAAPRLVVADAERLVELPVGLDVRIELVVLVDEERVGPAR